ncbi:sensor histidine kinase [Piscinibacter sp.]|uniref:sensor histidine kinase n=1 Tax=Piscinibacter sp. TaxID=1903157 RepID=UPI002F40220F
MNPVPQPAYASASAAPAAGAAKLRAQLQQAQRQLLQAEKLAAIGQLAAGVAHEINNPIGYVLSNIGALAGYVNDLLRLIRAYETAQLVTPELERLRREIDIDFLAEDILSLLAESQDGIDRVQQIVHSLKDFARADDDGEFVAADLRQCIESTLNVVNNEIKHKAEVRKEFAELPPVPCRPSQINHVIMNLLRNAAQAIGQRGEIVVRTVLHEEGALLEVSDNGSGIAPEHLDRIFEPFFTTRPVGQGTGLGLSLAYGIVRDHGGWIKVDSALGRGARFRVWLPLHRIDAPAESTQP